MLFAKKQIESRKKRQIEIKPLFWKWCESFEGNGVDPDKAKFNYFENAACVRFCEIVRICFRYINSDTAVPGEVGPQKDMEMSEAVPLVLGKDRDMDRVISRSMDRSMSRSMGNWPIQPTPSPAQPQLSVLPLRSAHFIKTSQSELV